MEVCIISDLSSLFSFGLACKKKATGRYYYFIYFSPSGCRVLFVFSEDALHGMKSGNSVQVQYENP